MKRLKGILVVVLIFLSGVFVGAMLGGTATLVDIFNKTFLGGPPNIRKLIIQRAKHDLKLDEDQNHQFWTILNDAGAELRDAMKPARPQIDAALDKAGRRMREILQPWQQANFDRFANESRKRWLQAMGDITAPDAKPAPKKVAPETPAAPQ